jgi:polysaccharide export outer membrane protein
MRKLILFLFVVCCASCSVINPSIMFKTPANYPYEKITSNLQDEYKLVPSDVIDFRMYTNDGAKLVEITSLPVSAGGTANAVESANFEFMVDKNGIVRFPVLGNIPVKGLTLKQLQKQLEDTLSKSYNKPFVQLKITNRRIYVFLGSGSSGSIVTLKNDNISLIEALTSVGGLAPTGKASKIKIIRGDLRNPQIYMVDLSTIQGVRDANLVVLPNDIIYVEPVRNLTLGILAQITPILSLLIQLTKR